MAFQFDRLALPGGALYCSQAALSTLTRRQAFEFGWNNIQVNSVTAFPLPGEAANSLPKHRDSETRKEADKYLHDLESRKLVQESLKYEQIVDSVLFLLGPQSSAITGTEISAHAGTAEYKG